MFLGSYPLNAQRTRLYGGRTWRTFRRCRPIYSPALLSQWRWNEKPPPHSARLSHAFWACRFSKGDNGMILDMAVSINPRLLWRKTWLKVKTVNHWPILLMLVMRKWMRPMICVRTSGNTSTYSSACTINTQHDETKMPRAASTIKRTATQEASNRSTQRAEWREEFAHSKGETPSGINLWGPLPSDHILGGWRTSQQFNRSRGTLCTKLIFVFLKLISKSVRLDNRNDQSQSAV